MTEKIIILDFGSQVTQLIGRRLRELNVYCEIYPFNKVPTLDVSVKGVILSGSPCSVRDANAPQINLEGIKGHFPLLGICYGAQYLANKFGGKVEGSLAREYGRAMLEVKDATSPLLKGLSTRTQVWMSHGDTISSLPKEARVIASTENVANAAYSFEGEPTYAVQFHPEVFHTTEGSKILGNFAFEICGCKGDWTPDSFIETTVTALKKQIGDDKVILGLSGGVDSTVAGVLLNKAIGHNLTCIFVNNGLLRKNEYEDVLASYRDMNLNVIGADASEDFLSVLKECSYLGLRGNLHAYGGSREYYERVCRFGDFSLGIGGVVTFKNSHIGKDIKDIPLERIVLETDAPYLSPTPLRGTRNESSRIPIIAAFIAERKGIPVEEVALVTTMNAKRLFSI